MPEVTRPPTVPVSRIAVGARVVTARRRAASTSSRVIGLHVSGARPRGGGSRRAMTIRRSQQSLFVMNSMMDISLVFETYGPPLRPRALNGDWLAAPGPTQGSRQSSLGSRERGLGEGGIRASLAPNGRNAATREGSRAQWIRRGPNEGVA